MARLYLLRHGIAVPHGTPDIPDDERPLTPRGERHVREVGKGLRQLGVSLASIITSPLPRAAKTAEIVSEVLDLTDKLETNDALRADRSASSIRDWLRTLPDQDLMLVGHNPWISELVRLLVAGDDSPFSCELRKGGIACLQAEALSSPLMALEWLARPKLFRRLAPRG
ncbi:phosphohistidine phosphatase SixA [Singulisphaera sp. PoT]|uniref:phosphohistidine phosphatase SixA n=1 Tax=Singulisphaera sp. PoT TaxID=3411797 RepID=UPI003BF596F0